MNAERGKWRLVGTVVLLAALGLSTLAAPKPPDQKQQALRILGLRYAGVRWQVERQITADFTGDGEADLAVPGSRERGFAVGVIVGPVGPLSRMLGLQWHTTEDGATSDCVVSAAPVLRAEALTLPADRWGCASDDSADAFCAGVRRTEAWMRDVRTKGTQGLRVTGDDCVELHLYWSPESKAFSDWKKK